MYPEAHLLASWVAGAKTTDNARDCRLVALAGILPDVDGLGIFVDMASQALGHRRTLYYEHYHHYLLHGAFAGILIALLLACFARRKWRVLLLALLVFHLHLLCDFVGSRGPEPEDLWPLFYFGPFTKDVMWIWKGQLRLDAWPNRLLSVSLFLWALWLAVPRGYSFVGVFNRRLDGSSWPCCAVGMVRGSLGEGAITPVLTYDGRARGPAREGQGDAAICHFSSGYHAFPGPSAVLAQNSS